MGWFTPLLRPTGLTPRMSAAQQADSNIELGRLSREREAGPRAGQHHRPGAVCGRFGDIPRQPWRWSETATTSLDAVTARNPNIKISAKVTSSHGAILKKDFPAIAEAVREVAAIGGTNV